MGYYVSYEINAKLDMTKEAEALAAINALHDPELVAQNGAGGSFSGGKRTDVWYSWVNNPGPQGFPDLYAAMYEWRFGLEKDGTFYWEGEKLGQEEILFGALAPYLDGDIYARGEDDNEWGFRFRDGQMINLACERNWTEEN